MSTIGAGLHNAALLDMYARLSFQHPQPCRNQHHSSYPFQLGGTLGPQSKLDQDNRCFQQTSHALHMAVPNSYLNSSTHFREWGFTAGMFVPWKMGDLALDHPHYLYLHLSTLRPQDDSSILLATCFCFVLFGQNAGPNTIIFTGQLYCLGCSLGAVRPKPVASS